MRIRTTKINKQRHVLNAMESLTTKLSVKSSILAELKKMGVDELPKSVILDFGYLHNSLSVSVSSDIAYETIMAHPMSHIHDTKKIYCQYNKQNVMCSHGNVICDIHYSFSCDLPEEDLNILRLIGKVRYEKPAPSYWSDPQEVVVCETGISNDLPF